MVTSFRAQSPAVLKDLAEAGQWQQRTLTAHATLDATAIKGPSTGVNFAMNVGQVTVTGSLHAIASGLATVSHVFVSLNGPAGGATALCLTARVNPTDSTRLDIFVWKPTAAGNTTPIAATTAVSVNWLAIGSQSSG